MRRSITTRWGVGLIGIFALLGCGGEGGDTTISGGSCPTCSAAPSVTSACSNETKTRALASAPTKGGGGGGGAPTTTTTTTTTGTPFAAPTTVNVNTPPSSSVSINCVSGATTP
jgi:hypothetical protein